MIISCPNCNQSYDVDDPKITEFECVCGKIVTVPQLATSLTKKCPYCGEDILQEAIKCKHCGEFLDGRKQSDATPYVLLALFLGGFGAHNFYAGQSAFGLAKLVISVVAVLTWGFGVGIILMGVNFMWCLFDIFSFSNLKSEKKVTPEQAKADKKFFILICVFGGIICLPLVSLIIYAVICQFFRP